jgi:hypothetical protein
MVSAELSTVILCFFIICIITQASRAPAFFSGLRKINSTPSNKGSGVSYQHYMMHCNIVIPN